MAGLGFACGALGLGLIAPPDSAFAPPERAAAVMASVEPTRDLPDRWPALFGTVPPPPPPPPEPEPEVVELPPEENTTYYLTGLVAGRGSDSWAMISENDRGLVVRLGDELIGGETVVGIDAQGVWLDYEGQRQLIPVQRSDLGHLVQLGDNPVATMGASGLLAEVTIPMEQLDLDHVAAVLAESGELAPVGSDDGRGMELIRVREGQIWAQMGLRAGDTILSVNGKPLQTGGLLDDMPDADLTGGPLVLEIVRDGARQMLKVHLDQG